MSLSAGLVFAAFCALAVTWVLSRRIQRPLDQLTHAASEVSRGHYGVRVLDSGMGPEFNSVAHAFNDMADKVARTEDTRRRMLSDLGHELKTPLATMSAYLEGLEDGVTEWGTDTSAVFRGQVERMVRLAQDISDVSRAEEGGLILDLRSVDMGDLISAAVNSFRDKFAAEGVELLAEHKAGVLVSADPVRLTQILSNLLNNALRHTPSGGHVTISSTQRRPDEVTISVSDDGEGITAEQLPHIFERFYRGDTARDRDRGGSGIGLTISKAFADAHNGSLSATSPGPMQGSSFTLTLPCSGLPA